ncbi:MAG: protein-disulfide reductase DsbD domain-containing protein, partial [Lysobacterales bacterium]
FRGWCSPILTAFLLAWPLLAPALEFDEIKDFGEVFKISAEATDRQQIEVSWQIADVYYLYNNKFLKFKTETAGVVLGQAGIPAGKPEFDELLGEEVIKFHGHLNIRLPLQSVSKDVNLVSLKVRSQGCMEDVFCYPPTDQLLVVNLPPAAESSHAPETKDAAPSQPAATLAEALHISTSESGQNALDKETALPADEAFVYEAIGLSPDTILARFTSQPGYYLYRDKIAFRLAGANGFEISGVELPAGTTKDDPEFGPVEVYYDQVEVPVHINRPAGPELKISLEADYQGCRDGDICYPPQTSNAEVLLAASSATSGPDRLADNPPRAKSAPVVPGTQLPPVSEQDALASMLLNNPAGALFAFFLAGILLAFTPCVFPMIPILSGIIAGQGDRMTTSRAFWLSLVYVLAMAVTYTIAGVLAGLFGQNLQALFQNPWILGFFIAIFIGLALSMFGFFELQLPASLQTRLAQASSQQQGGSLTGVAVMGFLSALIVGPCVAPPLAAALIVIGASG